MKRILFLLTIALAASLPGLAVPAETTENANPDNVIQADSAFIAEKRIIAEIVRDEIKENKELWENGQNQFASKSIAKNMIPITAISMPFITIIVIALALIAAETKRRRRKYELVKKAIEANYQIPPYVFQNNASVYMGNSRKTLTSAITLIAVGFSLSLFFLVAGAEEVASLMLMIFLIGLGKLIVAIIEIRNESKSRQADPVQPPFSQENAEQD